MSRRGAVLGVVVVVVAALSISLSAAAGVISADISPSYQAKTNDSQFGWWVEGEANTPEDGTLYYGDGRSVTWSNRTSLFEYEIHTFTWPCGQGTYRWNQTWNFGGTESYASVDFTNSTGACR